MGTRRPRLHQHRTRPGSTPTTRQGPVEDRMSSDVIIGHDGKPRCVWAGAGDTAFGRYHDEVWGTRTDDESAMFEALTLGVFQVGLSWAIVFGTRRVPQGLSRLR